MIMAMVCPKCGYARGPNDGAPEYECPQCGIIYAKCRPSPPRSTPGSTALRRDDEVVDGVAHNGLKDDGQAALAKILLLFAVAIVIRELFAFSSLFRSLEFLGREIAFFTARLWWAPGIGRGFAFIAALLPAGLLVWHGGLWRRMRVTPLWLRILAGSMLLYFIAMVWWLPYGMRFLQEYVKTAGGAGVLGSLVYALMNLCPQRGDGGDAPQEATTIIFVALTILLAHFMFYLPGDRVRYRWGWNPLQTATRDWLVFLLAALIVGGFLWLSELRHRLTESPPGIRLLAAGAVMVVVFTLLATFLPGLSRRPPYIGLVMIGVNRKGAIAVEACFVLAAALLTVGAFRLFTGLLPKGRNPFREG